MTRKPVSYRDLRNTPGQVFERLASGEALELVADGVTRAVLLPVEEGDAATVLDAWKRGRTLLALSRLQLQSRASDDITPDVVDAEIAATRKARKARHRER